MSSCRSLGGGKKLQSANTNTPLSLKGPLVRGGAYLAYFTVVRGRVLFAVLVYSLIAVPVDVSL